MWGLNPSSTGASLGNTKPLDRSAVFFGRARPSRGLSSTEKPVSTNFHLVAPPKKNEWVSLAVRSVAVECGARHLQSRQFSDCGSAASRPRSTLPGFPGVPFSRMHSQGSTIAVYRASGCLIRWKRYPDQLVTIDLSDETGAPV